MKTGRPQTPYTHTYQFLIAPAAFKRLRASAKRAGRSLAGQLRWIIDEHLTADVSHGKVPS